MTLSRQVRKALSAASAVIGCGLSTATASAPPLDEPPQLRPLETRALGRAPAAPLSPLPLVGVDAGGVSSRGASGAAHVGSSWFVSASAYPANAPMEDRCDVCTVGEGVRGKDLLLAAVFDGHGGWQASEFARRTLLAGVAADLAPAASGDAGASTTSDPMLIAAALTRAFERTDSTFVNNLRSAFSLGFGDLAHVGCCALAAVVTPTHVIVANAGDCRAVLGHVAVQLGSSSAPGAGTDIVIDGQAVAAAEAAAADAANGSATGGLEVLPEPTWVWHRLQPSVNGSGSGGGNGGDAAGVDASGPARSVSGNGSLLNAVSQAPGGNRSSMPSSLLYAAVPLSLDHNAREPRERARLTAAHPKEEDIVTCKKDHPTACYVKSRLQPTRALGDAYLKDAEFNIPLGASRLLGRHVRAPYTPPYIRSTPEIRIQAIAAESEGGGKGGRARNSRNRALAGGGEGLLGWMRRALSWGGGAESSTATSSSGGAGGGDGVADTRRCATFLILACDGVWDVLTNEEAVAFVAKDVAAAASAAASARASAIVEGASVAEANEVARTIAAELVSSASERLCAFVLARTASDYRMPLRSLLALKCGGGAKGRREVHDDLTCVVTFCGDALDAVVALAADMEEGSKRGGGAAAMAA